MSGYAWTATRICAECRADFKARIYIAADAAGVVWWRLEPTCCHECMETE